MHFRPMSDLIRAIEADLFGSYEWSADLYVDLAEVPEATDRLAVARGLLRAYEALEERAEDAMRAADRMVAAEAELSAAEATLLAPMDAPRERLFETADPDAARLFLEAFEPAWAHGPRESLVPDAILAALAQSNILAPRRVGGEPREFHRASAEIYASLAELLRARVAAGGTRWTETAAAAVNRRVVALRLAGDEQNARQLAQAMGAGEFAQAPRERDGA